MRIRTILAAAAAPAALAAILLGTTGTAFAATGPNAAQNLSFSASSDGASALLCSTCWLSLRATVASLDSAPTCSETIELCCRSSAKRATVFPPRPITA